MSFVDYTSLTKQDVIPLCGQCGQNDCSSLIDSVLSQEGYNGNETQYQTLPIWHCSRCNRVYGDRSYRVSNVVGSNVVGGGILPTEPPMTTSTFKWATEDRLAKLEQRLEQMQQTIDQQKDDILNSLRSRVNNFTLD